MVHRFLPPVNSYGVVGLSKRGSAALTAAAVVLIGLIVVVLLLG